MGFCPIISVGVWDTINSKYIKSITLGGADASDFLLIPECSVLFIHIMKFRFCDPDRAHALREKINNDFIKTKNKRSDPGINMRIASLIELSLRR